MAGIARLTYPEILNAAWADHLKPREEDAPTVISLFAGCGGSSLGYSMAGYRELLAVEWEENAVDTFRLNFPDVPVYHGDVSKLSVEAVLERCKLQPGELDVLDGSPPCQGFSTAGKRNLDDSRNQLFQEYVRLLRGLEPRAFIMENVSGMVKGKMRLVFADIMRELRGCGYQVSARLMNSMYFDVPQSRARVIFIGLREGSPTHPQAEARLWSVRQAIGHLPPGVPGTKKPQLLYAWSRSRPGQSLRKAVHYVGSFQSVRLNPNKPSTTQIKSTVNWHYAVPRSLTHTEAAILNSFPTQFVFAGSKAERQERIGNSVPPLFMRAIAGHVRGLL